MAVNHFFIHGEIPPGCNSSFIALIPKVPDANLVKDFRPISLIGSIYKIIAKILSNRLVNEVQSAFIAERQMLDGSFILNEILQWCTKKKKKTLIFKVDFENAFDSIRWDFLDDVLKEFGFRCKWRNWIQSCLTSFKGSILVNGCPTNEFQFYKGLKQGNPLSIDDVLKEFGFRVETRRSFIPLPLYPRDGEPSFIFSKDRKRGDV
ncbi:RNA-directed DNA polymerase, eukaryota [Tanacetum coccineum]